MTSLSARKLNPLTPAVFVYQVYDSICNIRMAAVGVGEEMVVIIKCHL